MIFWCAHECGLIYMDILIQITKVFFRFSYHPNRFAWWRHQMEKISALLVICAGNRYRWISHTQRPVTQIFDVSFDLRLNKRLSKQSWGWWFETVSRPLWRHRNVQAHPWASIHCKRCRIMGIGIPNVFLRRPYGHPRFIIGIPIPIRQCLYGG